MIKVITNQSVPFEYMTEPEFKAWLEEAKRESIDLEVDIETNVDNQWCRRKIATIQFGYFDTQVVIDMAAMTDSLWTTIKSILEDKTVRKLAHNAKFEYITFRFHDVIIRNLYCTMIAEQVCNGGEANGNYSLQDLTLARLGITVSKEMQKAFFPGCVLTKEHIEYAAEDVTNLTPIKESQDKIIEQWKLESVVDVEMRSLLGLADMTFYGMKLNTDKWTTNINSALPIIAEAKVQLDAQVHKDILLRTQAMQLGYLSKEDKLLWNWNSSTQAKELLQKLMPDLAGSTKLILKKYMSDNPASPYLIPLIHYEKGNKEPISSILVKEHRDWLIEKGYLLPAGQLDLNWNSTTQVLPLLQAVAPRLKSLAQESVANQHHPIFKYHKEYVDTLKLTTTYGQSFIDKHVEDDGMVRSEYNQVVSTGRTSSRNPNMQNIPAKESVGTLYRNAFEYLPGWEFVDSDYSQQELCIIAHIAKDDVWFKAIKENLDLHSVVAAKVFKSQWVAVTEEGCEFVKSQQKCKCKGHKKFRTFTKTVNFGLAYGMSKYKLSATLEISVQEAQKIIDDYFIAFPQIKVALQRFGVFGVRNGYIRTMQPYSRVRWFSEHHYYVKDIEDHLSERKYSKVLGEIERASMNMPIQGTAGNMLKLAVAKVYEYIQDNNLQDSIRLVANVHDQLTVVCNPTLIDTEFVMKELDRLMVEAGLEIVSSGLVKADTQRSSNWTK